MGELQVVVFDVNGELFGAETSQVFQIIRYQEATKLPRMPKFIEGILNFRNSVLPVVNLAKRFDMGDFAVSKKTKILVTSIEDKFAGFIVNDVSEIVKFSDSEVSEAPDILSGETAVYLKKVARKGDKLISIIDLEKILTVNEIKKLSNINPKDEK
ncbi:MAG TPA: chemotaxis protein CheW [Clostridia bacterium]|nr:chemotaxis protein CheW [Clostridia bacterium]